jgi:hypothetical protein
MNTEQAMRNEELTGEVASRRLGDLLLLPASYGGLALLIVNDHYLKSHLHNAVSGKLSDVAGLMSSRCWLPLQLKPQSAPCGSVCGASQARAFAQSSSP